MTAQRKALITIISTAVGSVVFGALAVNVSGAFIAGVLIVAAAGGIALMSISCPKCSYPVTFQKHRVFGSTVQAFSFTIPSACPNCGQNLK